MRVLQLAPIWETVPPPAYGGTEAVVSVLCEELVQEGVDVTLCAAGDSTTRAELCAVSPISLRTADGLEDKAPYDWTHIALSLAEIRSSDFDLVHNHAGELAMAMNHLIDTPMLTTVHCLPTPDSIFVWDRYNASFNTLSHAQRVPCVPAGTFEGVVHNAIDVESYPYSNCKSDYLLFLSRMAPEKGAHIAIEVANRLNMRLIMAGKVDSLHREYFETAVAPHIDGERIAFLGEADATLKRTLYRAALCLLAPLCWDEPFGLVMVEAMACGTPVVAFRRGAAPEIVADECTGYIVDDVEAMARAVQRVGLIDPQMCREHVSEHFSPGVMAHKYLEVYRRILDRESSLRAVQFVVPEIFASTQPARNGRRPRAAAKQPAARGAGPGAVATVPLGGNEPNGAAEQPAPNGTKSGVVSSRSNGHRQTAEAEVT